MMIRVRDMEERLYNHDGMRHGVKYIYYPITLFRNVCINKIPSRHFRRLIDRLLGARFGEKSFLFRRVEVLFPKGLWIHDYSNVGWFTLLDARGGIEIGSNVTIASYCKLITGSHDINTPNFKAKFLPITVGDYAWICTGATICQNVHIGEGAVVAAGAVVTRDVEPYTVVGGYQQDRLARERQGFRSITHPFRCFINGDLPCEVLAW